MKRLRIGHHCTDMAIDSQRAPRAQQPLSADSWLGPVLVAHGVLTPRQAERLQAAEGSVWSAALQDGASDEDIVAAVSRAYRVPQADLSSAQSRTIALLPESARPQASGGPHQRRRPGHPDRHRRPARPGPGADAPLRDRPGRRLPDRGARGDRREARRDVPAGARDRADPRAGSSRPGSRRSMPPRPRRRRRRGARRAGGEAGGCDDQRRRARRRERHPRRAHRGRRGGSLPGRRRAARSHAAARPRPAPRWSGG